MKIARFQRQDEHRDQEHSVWASSTSKPVNCSQLWGG